MKDRPAQYQPGRELHRRPGLPLAQPDPDRGEGRRENDRRDRVQRGEPGGRDHEAANPELRALVGELRQHAAPLLVEHPEEHGGDEQARIGLQPRPLDIGHFRAAQDHDEIDDRQPDRDRGDQVDEQPRREVARREQGIEDRGESHQAAGDAAEHGIAPAAGQRICGTQPG
ncbi:MAG TPA: hypothetical protein VHY76_04480, partial [Acetobacteraceae bacterium]|nr:hypothetical protein [Acetobacteraceae bacterium]